MSELDAAIDRYRAAVLRQDAIARQRLIQAYADALRRLRPLIELAEMDLLTLDDVSSWRVFQLERWRELEAQLYDEIAAIGRIENLHLTEQQRRLVAMAGEHSRALALVQAQPSTVASIATGWAQLSPGAVEALIGVTIDGAPLARLFDAIGPDVAGLARQMMTEAIALGEHPRMVANALTAATNQAFARTYTIARTEMLRAYRTASIREYQQNSDILDGWVWVAAKSARTCAACLALDGDVFPLEQRFMRQHVNCRCSAAPSVRGVPWQRETGSEWLAKQPASVQDDVLGKAGGEAYRAGDVELRDFVRQDVSGVWGPSYRDGGIGWARQQAEVRRGGSATDELRAIDRVRANVTYPEHTHLTGLSEESAKQIADSLEENMKRFTPKAGKIDHIDAGSGGVLDHSLMGARPYQGGSMTYHPVKLEKYRTEVFTTTNRRFGVSDSLPESQRVAGVLTHEWGHIIDFASPYVGKGRGAKAKYEASERFFAAFKSMKPSERISYQKSLSDYGLVNRKEFFAESYSKYVYEKDDMPQVLIDVIEAILKEYIS